MPALSAFLPPDFDPGRPVALIAGQGIYPVLVAQAVRRAGVPLRLIAFDEETRPDLIESFPAADRRVIQVGQLGKMLATLKDYGAGYALMGLKKGSNPNVCGPCIHFADYIENHRH